jgi:hypothetical protein
MITKSQTLAVLRSFLVGLCPSVEVVDGQDNDVPEPTTPDFMVMTVIMRERLATNMDTDEGPSGITEYVQPTKLTVQVDVHGPNSDENVQLISTMFRDEYAVDQFGLSGQDVTPLYCNDPHQVPFINGEQQFEFRWSVDMFLQVNPVITLPQQFATVVNVDLVSVDATYAP